MRSPQNHLLIYLLCWYSGQRTATVLPSSDPHNDIPFQSDNICDVLSGISSDVVSGISSDIVLGILSSILYHSLSFSIIYIYSIIYYIAYLPGKRPVMPAVLSLKGGRNLPLRTACGRFLLPYCNFKVPPVEVAASKAAFWQCCSITIVLVFEYLNYKPTACFQHMHMLGLQVDPPVAPWSKAPRSTRPKFGWPTHSSSGESAGPWAMAAMSKATPEKLTPVLWTRKMIKICFGSHSAVTKRTTTAPNLWHLHGTTVLHGSTYCVWHVCWGWSQVGTSEFWRNLVDFGFKVSGNSGLFLSASQLAHNSVPKLQCLSCNSIVFHIYSCFSTNLLKSVMTWNICSRIRLRLLLPWVHF